MKDEPHRTIRFGLLSTAAVNSKLLQTRSHSRQYEFIAVGSRDLARARAYALEHGIARAYGSYEGLLADPDVEAVYVALPNALHHAWTMRALATGKHVLCEKPYSRVPGEVEAAFAAARRGGLVLSEGYMWRYNSPTSQMVRSLPEIGTLQAVRATFFFPLENPGDFRLNPVLGGGALLDVGCYCVSAARLLAGAEPERVYAEALAGPTGVDLTFTGVMRFGTVVAEFSCGFSGAHQSLEAIGSTGTMLLSYPWSGERARLVVNGWEQPIAGANSYRLQAEDFCQAVRTGGQPLVGFAESLGQARTLDALLRSLAASGPIDLPAS